MTSLTRVAGVTTLLCCGLGGCCDVRDAVHRVEPPSTYETLCPNAIGVVRSFFKAADRKDCHRMAYLYPEIQNPLACQRFLKHLRRHGVKLVSLRQGHPIGSHQRNSHHWRGCLLRAVFLRRGRRSGMDIAVTWSRHRPRISFR